MKNRFQLLLIALVIFFIPLLGVPDTARSQSVDFGITGGVNISSHLNNFRLSQSDINLEFEPDVALRYQLGFIARKHLRSALRLQVEPSLVLLGAQYDDSFTLRGFDFQTESYTNLLYFQLPLLLQLTTVPSNITVFGDPYAQTTYHVTGGIFGGYLLDGRFTGTNRGNPIGVPFEGDFSNDVTYQYSSYDGGTILGIGLERGKKRKIGFEARALYSVLNSGYVPEISFETQNIAVMFSLYFLL